MSLLKVISQFSEKSEKSIIGLMSGMSMDGVDLAHIKISGEFPHFTINLEGSYFKKYEDNLIKRLTNVQTGTVSDIANLNIEIGDVFTQTVFEYAKQKKVDLNTVDLVGSHGQAIYYDDSSHSAKTLQIGCGSLIASKLNKPVVFNFRMKDIAVGGRGAPLTPYLDYILYHKKSETIAVNNLGSISNLTIVNQDLEDTFGTDIGPANMPIDYFSKLSTNFNYDKDGVLSSDGQIIQPLLDSLINIPFFKKDFPKAAGYNEFGPAILEEISKDFLNLNVNDLVRTAVEFSALTTSTAYNNFISKKYPKLNKVYFSGGGVYNKTLMKRLKELMPSFEVISLADHSKAFADSKEAILIAVLAHQAITGEASNIPHITGAKKRVSLGEIAF